LAARDGDTFEVKFALFSPQKSTFEEFDAGLKLRILFNTHKTTKNRRKNFRVIYTLIAQVKTQPLSASYLRECFSKIYGTLTRRKENSFSYSKY